MITAKELNAMALAFGLQMQAVADNDTISLSKKESAFETISDSILLFVKVATASNPKVDKDRFLAYVDEVIMGWRDSNGLKVKKASK